MEFDTKATAIPGTSTTYTINSNPSYRAEEGWLCPRCKRINAPWVRQCDCSPSNDKITINPCDQWWTTTKVDIKGTTDGNIHPNNITWSTNTNPTVGGSDYPDGTGGWTNVIKRC